MITDRQVRLLRQKRMEGKTQETAAAKAGMNGVSLKVDSEGFWVASEVPLQVVSSSVGGRPRRDQPYPQRGSAG